MFVRARKNSYIPSQRPRKLPCFLSSMWRARERSPKLMITPWIRWIWLIDLFTTTGPVSHVRDAMTWRLCCSRVFASDLASESMTKCTASSGSVTSSRMMSAEQLGK